MKLWLQTIVAFVLIGAAVVTGGQAKAGLMPDIDAAFFSGGYDQSTNELSVQGYGMTLIGPDGIRNRLYGTTVRINATIDEQGELSGGTLSIDSSLAGAARSSGTRSSAASVNLLQGTFTDLTFAPPGVGGKRKVSLAFRGTTLGGQLANQYGALFTVRLHGEVSVKNPNATTFLTDFNYSRFSSAANVTRAVPEPSAIAFIFGLGLVSFRRRK